MVSYVLAVEFGSGWPPLGKPVEVEVCSLWSIVRFHHCVLLPQECVGEQCQGGSCGYGNIVVLVL